MNRKEYNPNKKQLLKSNHVWFHSEFFYTKFIRVLLYWVYFCKIFYLCIETIKNDIVQNSNVIEN